MQHREPTWQALPVHALATGVPDGVQLVTRDGAPALLCRDGAVTRIPLPVERLRGRRIRWTAEVAGEAISAPPQPWNGVKLMLHIERPDGADWPQAEAPSGTFGWRPLRGVTRVPADAKRITLVVGLEQVTGAAWFRDVRWSVEAPLPAPRTGRTRYRGAMVSPAASDDDLKTLAGWGANLIRWQLLWGGFPWGDADTADIPAYDAWFDQALRRLEQALTVCESSGLRVVVDLHSPPGGRDRTTYACRVFQDRTLQEHFLTVWKRIVQRIGNHSVLYGYDLMNEPCEGVVPDGQMNWQQLALETGRLIRQMDRRTPLIIGPAPWGGPAAMDLLEPVPLPQVIYSPHMYEPMSVTHQGVFPDKPMGFTYPGMVDGRRWDRQALRDALQPVVDFQARSRCPIYIGEFSCIRWAPGLTALHYLRDLIDLFEEYGWDWTYHAFREWHGWSVEHGPDRDDTAPAPRPTARARLLQSWFRRNG